MSICKFMIVLCFGVSLNFLGVDVEALSFDFGVGPAAPGSCLSYAPHLCVEGLSHFLRPTEIDSSNEILRLTQACNLNTSADCGIAVCSQLSVFGCDDLNEALIVAQSCSNNTDGACVRATCARIGQFGCDELQEVTNVAKACASPVSN